MSVPRDTKTPKKIDLPVTGMTCAACAGAIQRGLGKIEGVEAVAVYLPAEKATITFSRKDVVPLRKIVDTIREDGVWCGDCTDRPHRPRHDLRRLR